ncbi:MAG: HEAT repeat domain-containing protein [Myxococcaceae bacterium]
MRPSHRRIAAVLVLVALGLGCSRKPGPHYVDRIEVSGATIADNAVLGLSADDIQKQLLAKLQANGHFKQVTAEEKVPREVAPIRGQLELAFTREAQKEGREGTYAEVGASLALRRRDAQGTSRFELVGLGEVKLEKETLEERQRSVRKALDLALDQIVIATQLQMDAVEKKDDELIKDLSSPDARVKEFAVRVLADRRNPAVTHALLDRLKSDDVDDVRRAIGGLIELREPKAVPLLIDLTRGKEPAFMREVVYALGAIGGEEAEAYLYTVAEGHDQPAIREAATQALEELKTRAKSKRREAK